MSLVIYDRGYPYSQDNIPGRYIDMSMEYADVSLLPEY